LLIIGSIPIIFNGFAMIILLLNSTNNNSLGTIDNASGIACVYELLMYYKEEKSRLNNFTTWFVFTGSEECGTMGIRNFHKVMKPFDKDSIIIINFDSIGKNVTIFNSWYKPEGYTDFYNSFIYNKIDLKVYENPKKITIGTHSDGYFLKKKMYQGIEFGDLGSYKFMHSTEDNFEKVDPNILESLCKVVIQNVKDLDEFYAKRIK
jgi:Zn-dependent M28 family amino/carboxypeptidase